MNFDLWLTLLFASIAISLSPGAAMVISMNYGLKYGLKCSLMAILGLQCGLFIQTFIVIVGLGSVIMNSLLLFNIVKWAGVGYLIFLGVMKFVEKPTLPAQTQSIQAYSASKAFIQSALLNCVNIKATIFLVAFIPHFLDPNKDLLPQFGIICVTLLSVDTLVMIGYSSLASSLKFMLKSIKAIRIQNYCTGVLLLFAAFVISLAQKS